MYAAAAVLSSANRRRARSGDGTAELYAYHNDDEDENDFNYDPAALTEAADAYDDMTKSMRHERLRQMEADLEQRIAAAATALRHHREDKEDSPTAPEEETDGEEDEEDEDADDGDGDDDSQNINDDDAVTVPTVIQSSTASSSVVSPSSSSRNNSTNKKKKKKKKKNKNKKGKKQLGGCSNAGSGDDALAPLPPPSPTRWQMGEPRWGQDGVEPTRVQRFRDHCGTIVNSSFFQTCSTILIVVNAVLLGALTIDEVLNNEELVAILEKIDLAILTVFTLEFSLQFTYLGKLVLSNGWLVFDGFIVLFGWSFLESNVSILRAFRIFRIFSLVSRWESLRTLFEAVIKTLPKMASIWITLSIFFYIFCVLLTTLYSDLYDEGYLEWDYFGRLDYTFITLFQMMTLDSWTAVVREVMDARPLSWLGFFIFVVITSFFVMNLVVAVICESLIELQKSKEDEAIALEREEEIRRNGGRRPETEVERMLREQDDMKKLQFDMMRMQIEMQRTLLELAERIDVRRGSTVSLPGGNGGGMTPPRSSFNRIQQRLSSSSTCQRSAPPTYLRRATVTANNDDGDKDKDMSKNKNDTVNNNIGNNNNDISKNEESRGNHAHQAGVSNDDDDDDASLNSLLNMIGDPKQQLQQQEEERAAVMAAAAAFGGNR